MSAIAPPQGTGLCLCDARTALPPTQGLLSGPDAEPLMFEMKEDINSSATRQMEFFVACTQRWAGVPLAHRAQVAQQIQASEEGGNVGD